VSGSSNSSSGSAPFQPYKEAANTEVINHTSCDQITIPADFNGRQVTATLDPGAALTVVDKQWLKDHKHVIFFPGSSAQLCKLVEPSWVGGFIKGTKTQVQYAVRNAVIGIGDGVFPINMQVVPDAAFSLILGLDFLNAYAATLVPRSLTDRGSGAQLSIPVPLKFRKKGVPVPRTPNWWNEQQKGVYVPKCYVRATYSVYTRPVAVTVVSPSCLAGL
jgi:hypothetical protein